MRAEHLIQIVSKALAKPVPPATGKTALIVVLFSWGKHGEFRMAGG